MKKKYIIVGIVLLGMVLFIVWGRTPKYGKIAIRKADSPTVIRPNIKYENDYFSFSCSDDYTSRREKNTLWLTGKARVMESLTIISREFTDDIKEDSGVKMRQIKNEDYSEEKIMVGDAEALFFRKKDKSERTVFVQKDGILTSFSMTVNSNDEKYEEKFQQMLASWEWK